VRNEYTPGKHIPLRLQCGVTFSCLFKYKNIAVNQLPHFGVLWKFLKCGTRDAPGIQLLTFLVEIPDAEERHLRHSEKCRIRNSGQMRSLASQMLKCNCFRYRPKAARSGPPRTPIFVVLSRSRHSGLGQNATYKCTYLASARRKLSAFHKVTCPTPKRHRRTRNHGD
jgi:hypothetical protein